MVDVKQKRHQVKYRSQNVSSSYDSGNGLHMYRVDGKYGGSEGGGSSREKDPCRLENQACGDGMKEDVGEVEAKRAKPRGPHVEAERENGEGAVGPMRVGGRHRGAPEVVLEDVENRSRRLDVWVGEDCSTETRTNCH